MTALITVFVWCWLKNSNQAVNCKGSAKHSLSHKCSHRWYRTGMDGSALSASTVTQRMTKDSGTREGITAGRNWAWKSVILHVTFREAKFRLLDGVTLDISVTHIRACVRKCCGPSVAHVPTAFLCVRAKEEKSGAMLVTSSKYDMDSGHAGHWGMYHHVAYRYGQTGAWLWRISYNPATVWGNF